MSRCTCVCFANHPSSDVCEGSVDDDGFCRACEEQPMELAKEGIPSGLINRLADDYRHWRSGEVSALVFPAIVAEVLHAAGRDISSSPVDEGNSPRPDRAVAVSSPDGHNSRDTGSNPQGQEAAK